MNAAVPTTPQPAIANSSVRSRWRWAWFLTLAGALVGLVVGTIQFHRNEARTLIWVGTLGQMGPVVPLSEVKARAESQSRVARGRWAQGLAPSDDDARSYRVKAQVDATDGTVVAIQVTGPEPGPTLALAQETADDLVQLTNGVQALAVSEFSLQLKRAGRAGHAFVHALEPVPAAPTSGADRDAELFLERWSGEASFTEREARSVLLQSRNSEVIDAAYLVPNDDQRALITILGALTGLMFGAAIAWGRSLSLDSKRAVPPLLDHSAAALRYDIE